MAVVRSIVGVLLTLLAALVAFVFVLADRIVVWRSRLQSKARAEELKRKVQEARKLADAQRAAVVEAETKRVAEELERAKARDPVDVANKLIERSRRGR